MCCYLWWCLSWVSMCGCIHACCVLLWRLFDVQDQVNPLLRGTVGFGLFLEALVAIWMTVNSQLEAPRPPRWRELVLPDHVRPSSSVSPLGHSRWSQIITGSILHGDLFPSPSDAVQFQVQICQTGSAVRPLQLSFSFFWVSTFFHFCIDNCLVSSQFIFAFKTYF